MKFSIKKKSLRQTVQKAAAFSLSGVLFLSLIFLPRMLFAQDESGYSDTGGTPQSSDSGQTTNGYSDTGSGTTNCNSGSNSSGNSSGGTSLTLCNPIKENSISQLLTDLLQVVIQIGAVVATLMFIYAGFIYLTAQGDEGKIGDAHKIFKNTAIGTAILLGAQAIVLILQGTINNVSGTNLFGGSGS